MSDKPQGPPKVKSDKPAPPAQVQGEVVGQGTGEPPPVPKSEVEKVGAALPLKQVPGNEAFTSMAEMAQALDDAIDDSHRWVLHASRVPSSFSGSNQNLVDWLVGLAVSKELNSRNVQCVGVNVPTNELYFIKG